MLKKLTIAVATMLICSATGMAQSIYALTSRQIASIPFRFSAGGRAFPAGTYTFEVNTQKQIVLIEGEDQRPLMFLANVGEAPKPTAHGQIVFRHSGDSFFLEKVRLEGSSNEARLVPSKLHRRTTVADKDANAVAIQAKAR